MYNSIGKSQLHLLTSPQFVNEPNQKPASVSQNRTEYGFKCLEIQTRSSVCVPRPITTDILDGFSAVDKLHKKTRRKEKRTGRTYTRAAAERTKSDQVTTRCLTSESILSVLANKTMLIYFFIFTGRKRIFCRTRKDLVPTCIPECLREHRPCTITGKQRHFREKLVQIRKWIIRI